MLNYTQVSGFGKDMNKNKNKYCFEPVEIKITNLKEYTDIAFVIDSPLFIGEAKKIRRKYGVAKPLRSGNYQHWLMINLGRKKIPVFYKEIEDLRLFLGFESNYQDVFENAVLGCNITDGDYRTTRLINFSKLPPFLEYGKALVWAILVTP